MELQSLSSGNRDSHDKRVLLWYFESQLKKKFSEFVTTLEVLSHTLLYVELLILVFIFTKSHRGVNIDIRFYFCSAFRTSLLKAVNILQQFFEQCRHPF